MFGSELIICDFMFKIIKIQMLILCNPIVPKSSGLSNTWQILYGGEEESSDHLGCRESQFLGCGVSRQSLPGTQPLLPT